MKKTLFALFLVGFSFLLISGVCFSVSEYQYVRATNGQEYVCIYVNSSIYSGIQSEINQYKSDLEADGFNVSVYNWTSVSVEALKANLTQEHNSSGMIGAVLVGNMPYALFEPPLTTPYPSDLFLMDLDGNWTNPDGDQTYNTHTNTTGDLHPEIFIGRLNPYCLNVSNPTTLLRNYFQRNHLYRNNSMTRYDSSLLYVDDDFESVSDEWMQDMLNLYSNITLLNNTYTTTNATDYIGELAKHYEFVHSFIHSDSVKHYFSPHPSAGQVNYTQIRNVDNKALFYNLYCCFAADFGALDNIGSHYLFSSNYTLAVFGSTRSGGFLLNQYLYQPLSEGKTLGASFYDWWFNDLYETQYPHGPNDLTVTGNVLLGDPFLRIREPSTQSPGPDAILIIGAGIGAIAVAGAALYFLKIRK
ncbi:MAG: C25 family cysteine peptidase [Promethearchaeota archaeon]